LLAVSPDRAAALVAALREAGMTAATEIGRLTAEPGLVINRRLTG